MKYNLEEDYILICRQARWSTHGCKHWWNVMSPTCHRWTGPCWSSTPLCFFHETPATHTHRGVTGATAGRSNGPGTNSTVEMSEKCWCHTVQWGGKLWLDALIVSVWLEFIYDVFLRRVRLPSRRRFADCRLYSSRWCGSLTRCFHICLQFLHFEAV